MSLPKISIVTPSYNQADYLERTICSVIDQNYPELEFIIIDGGSTDGSIDVIKKYEKYLTYWTSEPDNGQAHAINKGLKMATGEWVAWQNSDDVFYPNAFIELAQASAMIPSADLIIGNMMLIDADDRELRDIHYVRPSYNGMLAEGMVLTNQSAFWRRKVHDEIGFLNETLHYCFDYEWFLRLVENRKTAHINRIWGGYRLHEETKTSHWSQRFDEEKAMILEGRELPNWKIRLYQLRRIALMLGQGDFAYFSRGVLRRVQGKSGELY